MCGTLGQLISFDTPTVTVSDSVQSVTLQLSRPNAFGVASVDFATSDVTAVSTISGLFPRTPCRRRLLLTPTFLFP